MPISERRQIENEMIFRRLNENVSDGLDEIDAMHMEDGNPHLIGDNDMLLEFICECSDENCNERISIKLSTYQKHHVDRDTFIVRLNHQVNSIEKIIVSNTHYSVVQKDNSTPEPSDDLNKTNVNNV